MGRLQINSNLSKNNKISIKKQNLTTLKSFSFYNSNALYIFRSATTNLIGTIFDQAQFQVFSDSLTVYSDINTVVQNFFTDGSNWVYDDLTTNADNYVIPANYIFQFSTSSDIDITVGGGAIIQKYYGGKLNLN